ncbi:MAG: DEAD/DEAH box helicase, partial [Bacteroidota bacterium]
HLLDSSKDLIASAQTGTGKTGAFGLPAVHLTDSSSKLTQTLIICPTRELCLQIRNDLGAFAKNDRELHIVAVYGGASIETQIKALRRGAQIVVATPGRAIDLLKRGKLRLQHVERIILDEADEMLSMGFKEDLETLFEATSEERQILLFSATMSKRVKQITKGYMQNPVEIAAERVNTAAKNVQHLCYTVRSSDRYEVLKRIADMNPNIYGITFCRTRRETKEVANKLLNDGYNADALHGDLSQAQRDEVMEKFRRRNLQMLVATDVASRGLDVDELTHVINFNLPDDPEVYVHRSGRTGRAGKSGTSIAVINTRESRKIKDIERISGITFENAKVPTGKEICSKQLYALIDRIEKTEVDEEQIAPFLPDIYKKLEWLSREQLIQHFVSAEFNRFLEYYKNSRDINVENGKSKREKKERERSGKRPPFARMFINVGAKQQLDPRALIGIINRGLGSSDAAIGKIDIMKNFSFFDLEKEAAEELCEALKGQSYEGVNLLVEISQNKPNSRGSSFKGKEKYSKRRKGRGGASHRGKRNNKKRK